jgi:hypothetical protein
MPGQNRPLGCVQPRFRLLRVPKLTPGFAAKALRVRLIFKRYWVGNVAKDWVRFWLGEANPRLWP